ncbi:unnamed protein product [Periconia digitata]|uniref:Cytochrome P450 alkane hydroxylase n=1 Tax=Periconia digitata TaxID=1303443 RepID=A0A9W4XW21_9PLEO|nr:unnamed protein product [Periconia digitata]
MTLLTSPTILLTLTLLTLYIAYTKTKLYLTRRTFKSHHHCKPCPHTYHHDPILALDVLHETLTAAKSRRLLKNFQARFARMGGATTYRTRMLTQPFIVTCEPANIQTILSLRFKDYSLGNRIDSFHALLGDGIFNSDGATWARSRALLRPSFARDRVSDLEGLEALVGTLVSLLPRDGATVDLQGLFFRFTLDSAMAFLFGSAVGSLEGREEAARFALALGVASRDIVAKFRYGALKGVRPGKREAEAAVRTCHEYVERFVDEAIAWRKEREEKVADGDVDCGRHGGGEGEEKNGEKYVFLRELVKQTTDRTRLRDELINVLLAGRDSTAALMANFFFEVAKRPDIWEELRREVGVLEGKVPSYEELRGFKLVKYCLNEILRLYPVVPNNARLAIRDTVLPLGGGTDSKSPLFVPAGTTIGYNPYVMHRNPTFYGPTAESFDPYRWATIRPGWEYLPFNGGPRICLGQQFALTEASYVVVRMVQEFARVESRDENGGVWVEELGLTLSSFGGAKVGLWGAERG